MNEFLIIHKNSQAIYLLSVFSILRLLIVNQQDFPLSSLLLANTKETKLSSGMIISKVP
jgi:hypothetical protein